MTKASERRTRYVDRLQRRRQPTVAQMEAAGEVLARQRAGPPPAEQERPEESGGVGTPAPPAARPEILLPPEEGLEHGQMLIGYGSGGQLQVHGLNFIRRPWRGLDSLREVAAELDQLLSGELPYLEFESPHDGKVHLLTRSGAERVLSLSIARTKGQTAPHSDNLKLVRATPDMLRPGRTHLPG